MKKKKSLLSLGILALVLVLGVGYAAVSAVGVTIGGTATVKDAVLKVDIDSVTETKTGAAVVTHTMKEHDTADTFTITDMVLNEEVVITYTIANHETDVAATLAESVELSNTNKEYFNASYNITNENIAAGGTTTVDVTVKLVKTPVEEADNKATISVSLEAKADNNNDQTAA